MADLRVKVTNKWTRRLRVTYYDCAGRELSDGVAGPGLDSVFVNGAFPDAPAIPFWGAVGPLMLLAPRWPQDKRGNDIPGKSRAIQHYRRVGPPAYTYLRIVFKDVESAMMTSAVVRVRLDGRPVELEVRPDLDDRPVVVKL